MTSQFSPFIFQRSSVPVQNILPTVTLVPQRLRGRRSYLGTIKTPLQLFISDVPLPRMMFLEVWEYMKVCGGKVFRVGWMFEQLEATVSNGTMATRDALAGATEDSLPILWIPCLVLGLLSEFNEFMCGRPQLPLPCV